MPHSRQQRSPRGVKRAEQQKEALLLRKAGATYRDIAARLGISASNAHDLVRQAFQSVRADALEVAEDVIQLEIERCDELLLAVWPAARKGNTAAIDRALRISERRMRLLGLERNQIEVSGPDGGPVEVESSSYERIKAKLESYAQALGAAEKP